MIVNFEKLFESDSGTTDTAKAREKFSEMVSTIGLDTRVLKRAKDVNTDTNRTGKVQWQFPTESAEFVKTIVERYTDAEFKHMRKGKFDLVSLATKDLILSGFTDMMYGLECDENTIEEQRETIKKRLKYDIAKSSKDLDNILDELSNFLAGCKDLYNIRGCLGEDDIPVFYDYATIQLSMLLDHLKLLYLKFTELRYQEQCDLNSTDIVELGGGGGVSRSTCDFILSCALNADKRYQELSKRADSLLISNKFIKEIKQEYNEIRCEMQEICKDYQIKLFGNEVLVDEEFYPSPSSPSQVLNRALHELGKETDLAKFTDEVTEAELPRDM